MSGSSANKATFDVGGLLGFSGLLPIPVSIKEPAGNRTRKAAKHQGLPNGYG